MGTIREIKGRIRAVGNIQRITKTMQMIATARFQAAQRRATAAQPYTRKISELVGELATTLAGDGQDGDADGKSVSHPLLQTPATPVNRRLVLVITSNRGLAGAYNGNVLRKATAHLRQHAEEQLDLEVVGKKGSAFFRFNRVPVSQNLTQFSDKPEYDQVRAVAERYMSAFASGQYDAIEVVYMAFHSMTRQGPEVLTLLPMRPPTAQEGKPATPATKTATPAPASTAKVDYEFSPDPAALLGELLPETVKVRLYQAFNEAVVSEQIGRMVAMKAATDAAGKMKKSLTRQYNRARQTQITTELSEIIGGAAALA